MKKIKKSKSKFFYIITLVFIVIVLFVLISQNKKTNNIPITLEELDIEIIVPSQYEVIQRFHTISITSDKGEIVVSRYGSFYENLTDHIKFLSKKNNVKIDILERIPSDKYEIYKVKINHSNSPQPEDISYFTYVDNTIYSFQANSEYLYSDLDAIAKSFRYNP